MTKWWLFKKKNLNIRLGVLGLGRGLRIIFSKEIWYEFGNILGH